MSPFRVSRNVEFELHPDAGPRYLTLASRSWVDLLISLSRDRKPLKLQAPTFKSAMSHGRLLGHYEHSDEIIVNGIGSLFAEFQM